MTFELMLLYKKLRDRFGYLDWWPGDTNDEIVIGTILTQQTSWKNVEKAIEHLKKKGLLHLNRLRKADRKTIEKLIRSSGYYRQKTKKLKSFTSYVIDNYGSLENFLEKDTESLRKELLSIKGIGPETADSILLYTANRPVFVIDAYTKRIMNRIYSVDSNIDYDDLKTLITDNIKRDVSLYNDFHAQFVELGKRYCRTVPLCKECPVNGMCNYYNRE